MDSYTAAGRIDTLTYPSGATLRYLRDSQGRTIGVMGKPTATAAEVSLVSAASYLPFGPLSGLTFGNGRVQTRVFDRNYAADRLFDVAANDGFDIDVSLDVAGNVISLTERQGSNSVLRSVDYDGQNRLTAVRDGANLVEGFGYDATGNRTARSTATATTPYTTVPSSHRLQSVGPITRGYDAAGNTTAINDPAPKTLIYNDLGRLREVKLSGALQAGYRYNGRGERIVKLHPTDVNLNRYFVYTDSGQLLGEYNRTGVRIAEYVWLDDTLVAIYSDHDASTYQFVQTDHLGTPRAVVHPSRNRIVWRWDLAGSAFGDHAPVTDPDADGKGFGLNLRYPGQYFDAESGLHYNYFRDYEPGTGRYVESDPIGLGDGPSTYSYVRSNPLYLFDQFGLASEYSGFNKDDEARMRAANEEARKTLVECAGCHNCGVEGERKDYCIDEYTKYRVIAMLESALYRYFPSGPKGYCAEFKGSNVINVYPNALGPNCCALSSTLAHEAGHAVGLTHSQIFYYERECFGCDRFGKAYD